MDKNRNIRLLYIIAFCQSLVFYGSIATIYRETKGIGLSQIFIIESISIVLTIIFEVPWGTFADKYGYKKTLLTANFILLVSKIIFWKASNFEMFLIERIFLALAISGLSGCDSAMLYSSIDNKEKSEKIFSKYCFYGSIGFFFASILSGFMLKISMEITTISTVISHSIAFIATIFLKEVNNNKEEKVSIIETFKEVCKDKGIIIFIISYGLIEEIVQIITVFLNQKQYLKSGIGIEYFGAILTIMTLLKLIAGKSYSISRKLGQKRVLLIFLSIIILSIGILIIVDKPILSVILIGIISLGSAIISPIIMDIKNKSITRGNRATILSIYSMIASITTIFLNPIIGEVAEKSLELSLLVCTIIGILALIIIIILLGGQSNENNSNIWNRKKEEVYNI